MAGGDISEAGPSAEDRKILQAADKRKALHFNISHALSVAFFTLLMFVESLFCSTTGFLLTRLVLDDKSTCSNPPIALSSGHTPGSSDSGCWHPKTFDKAIIIIIDALRYDFTVPFVPSTRDPKPHDYHNTFTFPYQEAIKRPHNSFLLPFIADPPTTTLQRLKGLTTGTLPTFIDAGSNFAGTAIDEDNLIAQLNTAGRNIVHLGDDTWHSLFPGLFDAELTRPFDSFNVWDLHSVDNGVIEHLHPLLHPSNATRWDFLIGHFLGVDHAGHRYGPDHPAMTAKLKQMNDLIEDITKKIDDETLLVIMGDHGMDTKGDHGGESDDEVEAALWMYSKTARFGRVSAESTMPPPSAKIRPVNQIDLVPTLALLLGLPIPFNNLGAPIDEAFIGVSGKDWQNLAQVNRISSAQTRQYQEQYAIVRKPDPDAVIPPQKAWYTAVKEWDESSSAVNAIAGRNWKSLASSFAEYQRSNLRMCKDLWARFDITNMILGIVITFYSLALLVIYARGLQNDTVELTTTLFVRGLLGLVFGAAIGASSTTAFKQLGLSRMTVSSAAFGFCLMLTHQFLVVKKHLVSVLPNSIWSVLSLICPTLLSIGFASNSYTIWEDEILLYFLALFGTVMLAASFRILQESDRRLAVLNSVLFLVFIRVASLSRLCREEQMPHCRSTFYASATSSTSAPWQLSISYLVAFILPSTIKNYYKRTQSYHGSARFWIGFVFQFSLILIALFWTLDAADDGNWLPNSPEGLLKTIRVYLAQFILVVAVGAGTATFAFQSPLISVESAPAPSTTRDGPKTQLVISGTANLYGSHFAVLPLTIVLIPLLLTQKPMGQGALALVTAAIFSLLDLLHLLSGPTTTSPSLAPRPINRSTIATVLGPVVLALLGHFAFFKTGHQATLASIQWDTAFIALRALRYPWAPLLVFLNTFAGQILCAAAVPACVLWRRPYRFAEARVEQEMGGVGEKGSEEQEKQSRTARLAALRAADRRAILADTFKATATHAVVYALVNAATTVWAAHLRRHLMLYRVFSPRWMLGGAGLVVAEVVAAFIGIGGVRWSVGAVCDLFGW